MTETPPPPVDPGADLKITRESLAAFAFGLCGQLGGQGTEYERNVGVWLVVQECHAALMDTEEVPDLAKNGTMNRLWLAVLAVTLNVKMHLEKGWKMATPATSKQLEMGCN